MRSQRMAYNRKCHKPHQYTLTLEDCARLYTGNCHYCGARPNQTITAYAHTKFRVNGIDRVDSTKGYVAENCVSCCATCNFAKRSMSITEFLAWIKRAYDHSFIQNRTKAIR